MVNFSYDNPTYSYSYSENPALSLRSFNNEDIKKTLDRITEKDNPQVNLIKVVSILFFTIVGFSVLDDIASGRLSPSRINKLDINNTETNFTRITVPQIDLQIAELVSHNTTDFFICPVLEEPAIKLVDVPTIEEFVDVPTIEESAKKTDEASKDNFEPYIPCNSSISPYRVILTGSCSIEEIDAAYAEKDLLGSVTTTPDPITVLPEPEIVIPCTYNVTAYDTFFEGDCTVAEMRVAFAERDKLKEQEKVQAKAEGRRMAEEFRKENQIILDKWDEKIEKSKKALEETIRRNAQTEDTPEEIAERLKTKRETACKMHQDIGHLPGFSQIYTPVCVKNEIELLGGKMSDNCDIIKQLYRKQSLLYHPDKNHAPDAQEKFNSIAEAYKKICP